MEILSEKAERMQAKKEVEIFKEIEERVRKEIKNNFVPGQSIIPLTQNGMVQSATNSITNIYNKYPGQSLPNASTDIDLVPSSMQRQFDQQNAQNSDYKRGSIIID